MTTGIGGLFCLFSLITLGQDSKDTPFKKIHDVLERDLAEARKPESNFETMYLGHLKTLEEETRTAGELARLLLIRDEIKEFRTAKERNYKDFPKLEKLRNIYEAKILEIRAAIYQERRKKLEVYLQKLAVLKKEKTRSDEISHAIEIANEEKRIQAQIKSELEKQKKLAVGLVSGEKSTDVPRRSSLGVSEGFRGRFKFATNGEVEIYLNGKKWSYKNIFENPGTRLTGVSRSQEVKYGDILVIKARSDREYRGIMMGILAHDQSVFIPFRLSNLRYLGLEVNHEKVTAETIASGSDQVKKGGFDSGLKRESERLELPDLETGGSEWFQGDKGEKWHVWGMVITPEIIVRPKEAL